MAGWALFVLGDPVKQGDLKCVGKGGSHVLVHSNASDLKPWRVLIADAVDAQPRHFFLKGDPVDVTVTFTLARPAGHWGTGRNAATLRASAPHHPTGYPDVDKLARAILDALTGHGYADDAQVVDLYARKRYATSRALTEDPPINPADVTVGPDDVLPCPGVVIRLYPKD